ncbi:hypothetical protein PLESTB_000009600 [Pleodorina starrii]|uniref:Uncharacterized protein n=1 Tax=Pleodorina starrii TaxID=330485 RepID=A0A9W6EVZ7_9CHLO|nr:hypothetical protein PLESTM_000837600 [Pleodorina starrii]GLC47637.1 hypothetical protein PLESTB_000009600 [Pleodorina starrii]GLC75646.1 hypothetical protein PLESTF_001668700 [Pleodorina starrii]
MTSSAATSAHVAAVDCVFEGCLMRLSMVGRWGNWLMMRDPRVTGETPFDVHFTDFDIEIYEALRAASQLQAVRVLPNDRPRVVVPQYAGGEAAAREAATVHETVERRAAAATTEATATAVVRAASAAQAATTAAMGNGIPAVNVLGATEGNTQQPGLPSPPPPLLQDNTVWPQLPTQQLHPAALPPPPPPPRLQPRRGTLITSPVDSPRPANIAGQQHHTPRNHRQPSAADDLAAHTQAALDQGSGRTPQC